MILDIQNIYTKYLDQANKADKNCDKIRTYALKLEQEFYISNKGKKFLVSLFQQQTVRSNVKKKC